MSERNRLPISALVIANAISLIGRSLTAVAVPWFVLETTGSAGKAGLSGAFAFLPSFFAGILGGAVVDRLGARMSAVVADIVSGTAILMVPLLHHTVGLEFWQLLILIMLSTMLDLPGLTARRSMLPELASLGRVRLERVNALLEGNNQVAFLLGPPLAGVLIALLGQVTSSGSMRAPPSSRRSRSWRSCQPPSTGPLRGCRRATSRTSRKGFASSGATTSSGGSR